MLERRGSRQQGLAQAIRRVFGTSITIEVFEILDICAGFEDYNGRIKKLENQKYLLCGLELYKFQQQGDGRAVVDEWPVFSYYTRFCDV
jgi:hypothetical protein